MDKLRITFKENRLLYLIITIHVVISLVLSKSFFVPIKENVGSENIAYKYIFTGDALSNDIIVRPLCWIYSHVLAFAFIVLFWKWVLSLYHLWKEHATRVYVIILLLLIVCGVLIILGLYPATITSPPDTRYNYVYAKEWLPMYWHGFLTNIVHCACLLFYPHPIFMSMIPFLFGINVMFYFTYHVIIKYSGKHIIFNVLIWGIYLLLMPETIEILTYAGRNYMYCLLCLAVFGIFLKDNLENVLLTRGKFILLCLLIAAMATWRSEGILVLIFFPIILFFVYFYKRGVEIEKKLVVKGCLTVLGIYLIFSLPGKYGTEKYQGYDYFIINTPGPLAVVWASDEADLSYPGYKEDLSKVTKVIPKSYFDKYGEQATIIYNIENLRLSRQSDAGDAGKDFLAGAYNILLHNWKIYVKYQINIYLKSIALDSLFDLPMLKQDPLSLTTDEQIAFYSFCMDYYQSGTDDIVTNYDITVFNSTVDDKLTNNITRAITYIHSKDKLWGGYVKIIVSLVMIVILIHAFVTRRYGELVIGILIMGLFAAVLLMAPSVRDNYFYYSYFNQYWFILFYWIKTTKSPKGLITKEK